MIDIQFLGAAGTVTGSKHLLKTPDMNILIDCGLFQGIKELRRKNWEPLPVSTNEIDLVIITHAHLDHTGYIPLLYKNGYTGKFLMTEPTLELAKIILRDSAKIQEEDAEKANRMGYSKHAPARPLYSLSEAEASIGKFEAKAVNDWHQVSPEIKLRFIKNGHILGSAYVELICYGKSILFSGDIGRSNSTILAAPEKISRCDYLIMESTYGDRNHKEVSSKDDLAEIINDAVRDKGDLLIPSFAIGRAQELMHIINELKNDIRIPDLPVFMDSPMGASATNVLTRFPSWHKLTPEQSKAVFERIKIIEDFHDTIKVIDDPRQKIVIAASGMITGGRVLEYLRNYIGDARNTILLVGYQAEGTRGRQLRSGNHEIKLFGKYYHVGANVREISSLSAHADQHELIAWLHGFDSMPEKIFLVHGEPAVRDAFRIKIMDEFRKECILPLQNEQHNLF